MIGKCPFAEAISKTLIPNKEITEAIVEIVVDPSHIHSIWEAFDSVIEIS
jgi:REP element-mobilizing transposase RayT